MFKRMILFALIAGLVYLNYTTPTIEEHKAVLLAQLQQGAPLSAELQQSIWQDVDYSNFMICSFMKTKEHSKMISSGYLKEIEIINYQWIKETREKLQQMQR